MVTFVYSDEKGIKPTLRYIPIEELNECYFIVCKDEKCPNTARYHIHPTGMPGCPRPQKGEYTGWNVCGGRHCNTDKWHLYGSHKKCQGSHKARGFNKHNIVPFVHKHVTTKIPPNEKVYHFNGWRFNDERSNQCCCCGESGPSCHFTTVTNFHLKEDDKNYKEPICRDCAEIETCAGCGGWGNDICVYCIADLD